MLKIGSRTYRLNESPGVYEVPLAEIEDLRMGDIPPHSSVHVTDLPKPPDKYDFYISATNGGDKGVMEYLSIFSYIGFKTDRNPHQRLARIRRTYLPLVADGELPDPLILPEDATPGDFHGAGFTINLSGQPEAIVREEIRPLLQIMRNICNPEVRIFICHASEDKKSARKIASRLSSVGADIWLDEKEIGVGDSIVEKIDSGLESASHVAVLLSTNSVDKPWVKRELSAALMRQLKEASVTVLPIRLDDCSIPPILADVKYADCRDSIEEGLNDVIQTLFPIQPKGT